MTAPIRYITSGFDIDGSVKEISEHPELWNIYTMRTAEVGSPHRDVDDIWIRYNAWDNFRGNRIAFNEEHESVWYPSIEKLPSIKELVMDVMSYVRGERLGGVFITKVPAGKSVGKHIDNGWHSRYYDKFAVQLKSNTHQEFCFDNYELCSEEGDLYTFDNSKMHWVTNNSQEDRITLIITIRGHRFSNGSTEVCQPHG